MAIRKSLCLANPCAGVEFPVILKGLFHRSKLLIYAEAGFGDDADHVPQVRGGVFLDFGLLRRSPVMRLEHVFIKDSKTPTGVAEVPLTDIAVEAFRSQVELAGRPGYSPAARSRTSRRRVSRRPGGVRSGKPVSPTSGSTTSARPTPQG